MTARRRGRLVRGLVVSVLSLTLLALVGELGVRWFAGDALRARIERARAYWLHGEVAGFAPQPHTLFRRPKDGSRPDVNAQGFSDRAWTLAREPGVLRVLCMGGSTTESGNDAGRAGAYPSFLEERLAADGRRVEVMNAGMTAWTSAESLVAWFLLLCDYRPDVVVLHHAINDVAPRTGLDFRRDYSHWRKPWGFDRPGLLESALLRWSRLYVWLRGASEPPPDIRDLVSERVTWPNAYDGRAFPAESAEPYVRNLTAIAESARAQGALVVLLTMPLSPDEAARSDSFYVPGTREHNALQRRLAAERGYLLCDVAQEVEDEPDAWRADFVDLCHLTPAGNRKKAERVAALLEAALPER